MMVGANQTTQVTRSLWAAESNMGTGFWPTSFQVALDQLFFDAKTDAHGAEIYVSSNGTKQAIALLKDIGNGTQNVNKYYGQMPKYSAEVNGSLVFLANDGIHGMELWKTDGTEEGTILLYETVPGEEGTAMEPNYGPLVAFEDQVYMQLWINGTKSLWTSDGTAEGTMRLNENNTFLPSDVETKSIMRGPNGLIYSISGWRVYVSDGTINGTTALFPTSVDSFSLTEFKGQMYFIDGSTLYVTNGTDATTSMVPMTIGSIRNLVATDEYLFYVKDCALYSYDGESSTFLIGASADDCPTAKRPTKFGNKILFEQGAWPQTVPYVSDGTPEGTLPLADMHTINKDTGNPFIVNPDDGSWAFITGNNASTDGMSQPLELWMTDGTPENTFLLFGPIEEGQFYDYVFFRGSLYITQYVSYKGINNTIWKIDIEDASADGAKLEWGIPSGSFDVMQGEEIFFYLPVYSDADSVDCTTRADNGEADIHGKIDEAPIRYEEGLDRSTYNDCNGESTTSYEFCVLGPVFAGEVIQFMVYGYENTTDVTVTCTAAEPVAASRGNPDLP